MVAYFSRDEHMRQADELQHLQRRLHFEIQRRQQAEAQLLTSQQTIEDISTHWITPSFWQSVFDASPLGLFAVDVTPERDFLMVAVNPVIERWTGRSAVEICGKTPEAAFGPEMGPEIRANYLKCAKKTPTIKRVRVELPKVTADVPFSGEMNLHQQTNRATASPLI
ncbi:hypothetical protein PN441_18635, partial [Spirulina major CS-329]